jgi:arsenate reductase
MTSDLSSMFENVPLEHRIVLNASSSKLQKEFDGQFNAPTIERFLLSSYDDFAGRATVTTYVPVFAERFARQRLKALSLLEGKSEHDVPVVLFLCVHNAGRSQMAMGYFKKLAGDRAIAWSGGSEPGSSVNPAAVEAMAEVGIDISEEFPKPWTDEIVRAADAVITMGCGDACPIFPGKRYEDWVLEDPAGLGVDDVRPIRGEIEARVRQLLTELNVPITD